MQGFRQLLWLDLMVFGLACSPAKPQPLAPISRPTGQSVARPEAQPRPASNEREPESPWRQSHGGDARDPVDEHGAREDARRVADPPPADPPPPSTCPAKPSGGRACRGDVSPCEYADQICSCERPCRGAYMPPERHTYSCRKKSDRRCPKSVPKHGDRCSPRGLQCSYGTCGGANAKCENKSWNVHEWAAPPSAKF